MALGCLCRPQAFSSAVSKGAALSCRASASLAMEHRLQWLWPLGSGVVARGLWSVVSAVWPVGSGVVARGLWSVVSAVWPVGSGVVAHGLWSVVSAVWPVGSGVVAHGLERGLSGCGTCAMVRGMWNLPGPGIKPAFPAAAGGFLSTGPPGTALNLLTFLKERKGLLSL